MRKHRGAIRPIAGRKEILGAARSIGIRFGWKAVTIRAVAQQLGYSSPLLYEHFRDKQELLTELAIEGQVSLAHALMRDLPSDPYRAVLSMVDRYWSFMLENEQVYRLMNGMDGVAIDRDRVTAVAQRSFEAATAICTGLCRETADGNSKDTLRERARIGRPPKQAFEVISMAAHPR